MAMATMPMFEGDMLLGHVDVFLPPPSTDGGGGSKEPAVLFPSNEIRISRRSPASDRCPPLAVLQLISAYSMRCKLRESTTTLDHPTSPLLGYLHSFCWNQRMTIVVEAGGEELHLVAMKSKVEEGVPCFWCWSAPAGLYAACLGMLDQRCLAIVFDLDQTLVVSTNEESFKALLKKIESRLWNSELDEATQLALRNQLSEVSKDNRFLKDFVHQDAITVNHEIVRSQDEKFTLHKPSGRQKTIVRPVIRIPGSSAVLTRLKPKDPRSSFFVNIRPGWDDLKSDMVTTSGCTRYKIYVCTRAGKLYAHEVWRLLDPEGSLISLEEISQRLICVTSDSKKSLERVFQESLCHPNMAMVIDDRMDVWDEKDRRRVHNLPAYNPSVDPKDKVVKGHRVLQILRKKILKVHQGFFSDFDGMLLKTVDELMYENDVLDLPCAPDVGDYLQRRIVRNSDAPVSPKNTSMAEVESGSKD
ncbi:unnamed protein product [Alopecurus aequalis]